VKLNSAAATAAWRTQCRIYRDLLRQKRESFWSSKIDSERPRPHQLWQSVDILVGQGHTPACSSVGATIFHRYFDEKVAAVYESTSGAPPPLYMTAPSGCILHNFRLLSIDDIVAAVRQLPDKQCASDPMPTRLLKDSTDVLAPFLAELCNRSLSLGRLGTVPDIFKAAYITPLLKKSTLIRPM